MTRDLIYIPAPLSSRRAGCLALIALYVLLLLSLIGLLTFTFLLNFSRIFHDVSRRALAAVFPYYVAILQPTHTPAERAAFSNAYATLTSQLAHALSNPHATRYFLPLNLLVTAARDRVITRAESAAFVSNVTVLSSLSTSSD